MQDTQIVVNIQGEPTNRFTTIQEAPLEIYTKKHKWSIQALRFTIKTCLAVGTSLSVYGVTSQTPTGNDCQINEKIHTLFTFALVGLIAVLTNNLVEFGMDKYTRGTYSFQFWRNLQHQSGKFNKFLKKESTLDPIPSSPLLKDRK